MESEAAVFRVEFEALLDAAAAGFEAAFDDVAAGFEAAFDDGGELEADEPAC